MLTDIVLRLSLFREHVSRRFVGAEKEEIAGYLEIPISKNINNEN